LAHDKDYLYIAPLEGIETILYETNQFEKLNTFRDYLLNPLYSAQITEAACKRSPPLFKAEAYAMVNYQSLQVDEQKRYDRILAGLGDNIIQHRSVPLNYSSAAIYFEHYQIDRRSSDEKKSRYFYKKALDTAEEFSQKYTAEGYPKEEIVPDMLYVKLQIYDYQDDYQKMLDTSSYFLAHFKEKYVEYQIDYYYQTPAKEALNQ
jgi:hypothetical protein